MNIAWVDLETSGLNFETDKILNIAIILTDKNLKKLDELVLYISHSSEFLYSMTPWALNTHTINKVIENCLNNGIDKEVASDIMFDFLIKNNITKGSVPLAGNNVCFDRRFLAKEFPLLEAYFHFRNIDVSSFAEMFKRWQPNVKFQKQYSHVAINDINESIHELQFYKSIFFPRQNS